MWPYATICSPRNGECCYNSAYSLVHSPKLEGCYMGFFSEYKRALNDGGLTYAGKPVVCPHCGNTDFEKSSAQLNTAGLTFLGLDWANRSAKVFVCKNCSNIQWFLNEPDE